MVEKNVWRQQLSIGDRNRRHATAGDQITAKITVEHIANVVSMGVFFEPDSNGSERQSSVPEIQLDWASDGISFEEPTHSNYFEENMRQSVYTVNGIVPINIPPGVYRLSAVAFLTGNGRWVRYSGEKLDQQLRDQTIEIYDERPDRTRPIGFRFEN